MIMAGDEFLRTQQGNNTPGVRTIRSVGSTGPCGSRMPGSSGRKMIIGLRKAHPVLRRRTFFTGEAGTAAGDLLARDQPRAADFSARSHSLAFALDGRRCDRPNVIDRDIYVAMNAWVGPLDFKIPAAPSCAHGAGLSTPRLLRPTISFGR